MEKVRTIVATHYDLLDGETDVPTYIKALLSQDAFACKNETVCLALAL